MKNESSAHRRGGPEQRNKKMQRMSNFHGCLIRQVVLSLSKLNYNYMMIYNDSILSYEVKRCVNCDDDDILEKLFTEKTVPKKWFFVRGWIWIEPDHPPPPSKKIYKLCQVP